MADYPRNETDVLNISSGTVVYDKDDKILLVLQKNGIWSLPKGSIKYDESIYDGALRETLEETQIDLSTYEPIAIEEYTLYEEHQYYLFIYKLNESYKNIIKNNTLTLNSEKIEWVPRNEWQKIINKKINKYKDHKINFLTLTYLNNKKNILNLLQ